MSRRALPDSASPLHGNAALKRQGILAEEPQTTALCNTPAAKASPLLDLRNACLKKSAPRGSSASQFHQNRGIGVLNINSNLRLCFLRASEQGPHLSPNNFLPAGRAAAIRLDFADRTACERIAA